MSLAAVNMSDALNSSWRINVSGRIYGPYSGEQIRAFASEGRVAPHSIVQSGEGPWITAIDDPVLAQLFVQGRPQTVATKLKEDARAEVAGANFVIIADLRSRGSAPFEAAVGRLGHAHRLNSLVWFLHSDRSAGTIRNELIQHIGHSDNLVIVDATRDRTAWFNLGPEVDAKIRKVWKTRGG
jgi:hypothetical protein